MAEMDLVFSLKDIQYIMNKLLVYGFSVQKIISQQHIYLKAYQYIEMCNLCIYEIVIEDDNQIKILEILDTAVDSKYRGKGIGTQLLNIIEKEVRTNKGVCIIGELQEDKRGEPLDKRKRFFARNGFSIWHDKRSKFSGWAIKKDIFQNFVS